MEWVLDGEGAGGGRDRLLLAGERLLSGPLRVGWEMGGRGGEEFAWKKPTCRSSSFMKEESSFNTTRTSPPPIQMVNQKNCWLLLPFGYFFFLSVGDQGLRHISPHVPRGGPVEAGAQGCLEGAGGETARQGVR